MNEKKSIFKMIHADTFHWTDSAIISLLLSAVLMILGQGLGELLVILPFRNQVLNDETGYLLILVEYLYFIGMWLLILLYCFIVKKNRPILSALWTKPSGNNVKFLLLGILLGFGTNSICAVAALLHKDIGIYFNSFDLLKLISLFLAVFVQSSAEELLCRGFLYQKLRKGYRHPAVAIILNATLFAALHLLNPGVSALAIMDIFITGIFFSLIVYYMDSIWCAMTLHAAWNFTQNIIYGLPNSGIVSPYSLFKLDAAAAKDSFAYSVDFGLEGTILAVAVMLVCSVAVYLIYSKKNVKPYDPWKQ
ncbi:CPBP family intramembrane glutamic endopeptidase [Butyrivibrio sp. YAB3001]|uniref:CPBP family intramembrane glutamic endopeptidase n=1 Tax=Butyrivibrio sp. YAB3001 TaxID=1520812 RepID=UPI0008F6476B|nr:CPBP family intramembrane glutamic endopeptidase [Butyrivibrio sp. YAB3001]SFB71086.1 hypothetical protein SAMN02910398_00374 [Butyrivibrio sp. YAB3001]